MQLIGQQKKVSVNVTMISHKNKFNQMIIICVKMSSMFTSNTFITDAPPTTTDIWPSFGTRRSTPTTTDTGSFMFCEST